MWFTNTDSHRDVTYQCDVSYKYVRPIASYSITSNDRHRHTLDKTRISVILFAFITCKVCFLNNFIQCTITISQIKL